MAGYSRLMEAGEEDIIIRQRNHLKELIAPAINGAQGRIVKTTGDGLLAEFSGARDAVRCAVDIQLAMAEREAQIPEERRIRYRIGINIGDVVVADDDIFGDDVNVAARLEQMAEPGGVCISDMMHQLVHRHLSEEFADLGSQSVKNISRPIRVWQWTPQMREPYRGAQDSAQNQQIGFCASQDNVQIAWATVGQGTAVLKAPNWLNHLEYDWSSPIWGPVLQEVSRHNQLVRFDQRGNGLSDWDVPEISETAMQDDMDAVVAASGLTRFAMLAISQGCAFAVRYGMRHPEKLSCIVMLSGYARGTLKRGSEQQNAVHTATNDIIRIGWGDPNPVYRHMFTENFIPDASLAQKAGFDELQRVASSPQNAARINDMNANVDVSQLASQLRIPVLVMHCEGDKRVPLEEGRRLATLIPGARFMTLPGNNHALVPGTPAYDVFVDEFHRFVDEHASDDDTTGHIPA